MEVPPVFLQKKFSLWKAFHNLVSFPERSGLLSLVSAVARPSGVWLEDADVAWESRSDSRARWPAHRRRRDTVFALLPTQLEPRLQGPPGQPSAWAEAPVGDRQPQVAGFLPGMGSSLPCSPMGTKFLL